MLSHRLSLADLKIAHKLGLGFACVLAIVAIMSGLSLLAASRVGKAAKVNNDSNKVVSDLDRGVAALFDLAQNARGFIITHAQRQLELYDAAGQLYAETMASARADATGYPDILPLLDNVEAAVAAWRQSIGDAEIRLARDPKTNDQAIELAKSPLNTQRMKAFRANLDLARNRIGAWSDMARNETSEQLLLVRMTQLVGGPIAVLLAGLIGFWLARLIATPVTAMAAAMERLAEGDHSNEILGRARRDEIGRMARAVQTFKMAAIEKLRLEAETAETQRRIEEQQQRQELQDEQTALARESFAAALAAGLERLSNGDLAFRLSQAFADEYEAIRADFNTSLDKLQRAMLAVGGSAHAITSGAGQISTATEDLSRRTEQQAASLEETAASLDEITTTVQRTAEGVKQARHIVAIAKADVETSSDVAHKAIEAMSGIEASSKQITQIIGLIDEIAFQTSLLALNAGVEAARAGDAGRGFAVVASEVRGLARRSAEAAKEIKSLITNSTAQVDLGVDLVAQTGQVLARIVRQVADINDIVAAIGVSAQEQSAELQQVNAAINQMDKVTQHNAATAEETTAAVHSLSDETHALADLIAQFELGTEMPTSAAEPVATAPRRFARG